jgi:hypothetical protein
MMDLFGPAKHPRGYGPEVIFHDVSAARTRLPASKAEGQVARIDASPEVTGRRLVSFLVSYMFVYLRPSLAITGH